MAQPGKSDPTLVQKAARGDRKAFRALFNRYFQAVYNFALTLACDPAQAEDITQEAFIRAHANIHRLGPPWNFRAWIFRLARNYFIDQIRKERDLDQLEDDAQVISPGPGPEREKISQDTAERVHSTLNRLPFRQREILILRELQGFSYAEIGEIMDLSSSNVKVSLHRARAAFQDSYGIQLLLDDPSGDCLEVAELLPALHDQEETLDREHFVREHLKVCEACRKRRDLLVKQSALLGAFIPVIPPKGLAEKIFQQIPGGASPLPSLKNPGIQNIIGAGGLAAVLGISLWLIGNMIFNTEEILPNFPGKGGGEPTQAALSESLPDEPTSTPQEMNSYSGPVPPAARCMFIEEVLITPVFLNVRESNFNLPMYFRMEGGVPGLSLEVPGETAVWEYSARLGGIDSGDCSLQGYPDRLYCIFTIPESMLGTYQDLTLHLGGCEGSVWNTPRVSVPEIAVQEPVHLVCREDLNQAACEAAGGTYLNPRIRSAYCACP